MLLKKTLSSNMCAVKAAVLAIELDVTAAFIFLSSCRGISEFVFFEIVVVVVVVLPLFLFDAFVLFDDLKFKDELGLCSETHQGQTSSSKLTEATIQGDPPPLDL
jgi:hypothetical protein